MLLIHVISSWNQYSKIYLQLSLESDTLIAILFYVVTKYLKLLTKTLVKDDWLYLHNALPFWKSYCGKNSSFNPEYSLCHRLPFVDQIGTLASGQIVDICHVALCGDLLRSPAKIASQVKQILDLFRTCRDFFAVRCVKFEHFSLLSWFFVNVCYINLEEQNLWTFENRKYDFGWKIHRWWNFRSRPICPNSPKNLFEITKKWILGKENISKKSQLKVGSNGKTVETSEWCRSALGCYRRAGFSRGCPGFSFFVLSVV